MTYSNRNVVTDKGCSTKDINVELAGKAAKAQGDKAGRYSYWKEFEGHHAWKTDDDKFAIWYSNKVKKWLIGWRINIQPYTDQDNKNYAGVKTQPGAPCPTSTKNTWEYYDRDLRQWVREAPGSNIRVFTSRAASRSGGG